MHYLSIAVGSDGDVMPLIGLCAGLRRRGHQATLMAAPVYDLLARENDIAFIPISGLEAHKTSIHDKFLLNTRYAALFVERHSTGWNALIYDAIRRLRTSEMLVLAVDRPNLWADLLAREALGVPVMRIELDLPRLAHASGAIAHLPQGRIGRCLEVRVESKWHSLGERYGLNGGLNQIKRLWQHARPTVARIALWPLWILGPTAQHHPCPTFGFLPGPRMISQDEQLSIIPASSRPFVVFVAGTAGTTRGWSRTFFDVSSQICRELGCAAMFIGGDNVADLTDLWDNVIWLPFAPLSEILKRANAVVHHGGIGTAAAAIENGVPQLLIPRVFGQPNNAEWLRRLGVAMVMNSKEYTLLQGKKRLQSLLTDPTLAQRSREYSLRFAAASDLVKLCDFLENPGIMDRCRARRNRSS